MARIEWDDSFSVHNDTIDHQHQTLFGYVNEFEEAKQAGKSNQALLPILDKILKYTEYHFSEEEQLMEQAQYPDLGRHQILHKKLIDQAVEAREKVANNEPNAAEDTQNFLTFWLKSHIKGIDTRYSEYL